MAVTLTSLRKAFIRQGFDAESEKTGVLAKNTSAVALEIRLTADGVRRVKFDQGWVSEQVSELASPSPQLHHLS